MADKGRREFLRTASAPAALGWSALGSRALGANDRLRVALVGLRGRGRDLIRCFHEASKSLNVEIAVLCDVDANVLSERASDYEKLSGRKAKTCRDMREVLDDKSIQCVALATPNHWHSLGAIWALQAGKHVYVEKPGSHNIFEGRKVMEAAAKYKLVVQHGTQNRSSPEIVEGINKLKEGVIGRVYLARGVAYKARPSIGKIVEEPVPTGLDWDAWQGPAPLRPYARVRHRAWHLLFDYGNGDIGNQGVHELDIIRWALDLNDHPSKVVAMGGTYIHKDAQQYPQVHAAMFEYAGRDVLVTFETRAGWTNTEAGMGAEYPFLDKRNVVGVIFIGTEGYMILPDYTSYYTFLGAKRQKGPSRTGDGSIATQPHVDNFIRAVRANKPEEATAPARELHYSSALPHLANIAWRTGRMLRFDPKTERFVGDDEANRLLTRDYRKPFVVPQKV